MFHEIIQHTIDGNHCIGCSPDNPHGMKIQSVWSGVMETRCSFEPQPHMAAASPEVLNGGVIATLIDCHAVCTAVSYGRRLAGPDHADEIMYATGSMDIRYVRPTPIDRPVEVRARITGVSDRKVVLECTLSSDGQLRMTVRVARGRGYVQGEENQTETVPAGSIFQIWPRLESET